MGRLTKKQLRIISRALDCFFSVKSLKAPSVDDFKDKTAFSRMLQMDGHRMVLMTDTGLSSLRTITETLHAADLLNGATSYSDVYSACTKLFEQFLSRNQRPDDGNELVALVRAELEMLSDQRTFVVPILGVELVGVDSLKLGDFKIVTAPADALSAAGVDDVDDHAGKITELTKATHWLIGSTRGTVRVAEEKFRAQAELLVGILTIYAASMYQRGATGFRIGVVMSPEEAHGPAAWSSWTDRERTLTMHRRFVGKQNLEITQDLVNQLEDEKVVAAACQFFQSDIRSPLEEAIAKAVYWYSSAHRESVPVMKLVKYWSAVETFFSMDQAKITQAVSAGLTAVLVFGGLGFVPHDDYFATKRRVAELYSARSKALHRASHSHVSEMDAADLSQWVAWMLISMISFSMRGFTTVEQIKTLSDRIDAKVSRTSTMEALGEV